MLISLNEALAYAEKTNSALAAVNVPFFEALTATIAVGEQTAQPIVLQHAQVHEQLSPLEEIGPAIVELAKRSNSPFVVHIDHGEDLEYITKGLEIGFNSCMIDGSRHDFQTNVELTTQVVQFAHEKGVAVEGELGVMTGNENGDPSQGIADESLFTKAEEAREFVKSTGVDCLAASFGTVHGLYRQKPNLNLPLIQELREAAGVPLVMHGGSGLSVAEYRESIRRGVRKINYYTYAASAAYEAAKKQIEDEEIFLFTNLAASAKYAVYKNVLDFTKSISNLELGGISR